MFVPSTEKRSSCCSLYNSSISLEKIHELSLLIEYVLIATVCFKEGILDII